MALGLSELRERSLIDQSEMNILLQQFHELREKVFERKKRHEIAANTRRAKDGITYFTTLAALTNMRQWQQPS